MICWPGMGSRAASHIWAPIPGVQESFKRGMQEAHCDEAPRGGLEIWTPGPTLRETKTPHERQLELLEG